MLAWDFLEPRCSFQTSSKQCQSTEGEFDLLLYEKYCPWYFTVCFCYQFVSLCACCQCAAAIVCL